jgi:hypothetical protein
MLKTIQKGENNRPTPDKPSDAELAHYFTQVFQPNTTTSSHSQRPPSATQTQQTPTTITTKMVTTAAAKMKYRKGCGHDGMYAESLKALFTCTGGAETIAKIFNYMLQHSWWPPHWSTLLLTPIQKPNKPTNRPDSYRPIHISIILAKLFCMITDTEIRLTPLLDNLTPQFGFRAHRGTRDGLFLTRTALHFAKQHNKPLYTCFIDFKGAFDRVHRGRLFEHLASIGLHPQWVSIIKAMYAEVNACLTQNNNTTTFAELGGVKQGDPLSPLLFILLLGGLHQTLYNAVTKSRNQLNSKKHKHFLHLFQTVILYADDLTLMAETLQQLQSMLDALQDFCADRGLTVSTEKTKTMVFGDKKTQTAYDSPSSSATYGTHTFQRVPTFKLLGSTLTDGSTGHTRIVAERHYCMIRATNAHHAAIARSTRAASTIDFSTHIMIYKMFTIPAMTYGCETTIENDKHFDALDTLQIRFIRWLTRAPHNTPRLPTIYEAGLRPISHLVLHLRLLYIAELHIRSKTCPAHKSFIQRLTHWRKHTLNGIHNTDQWLTNIYNALLSHKNTSPDATWSLISTLFNENITLTLKEYTRDEWLKHIKGRITNLFDNISFEHKLQCKQNTNTTAQHEHLGNVNFGLLSTANNKQSERSYLEIRCSPSVTTTQIPPHPPPMTPHTTHRWTHYPTLKGQLQNTPQWWAFARSITAARAIYTFRVCRPPWMSANDQDRSTPRGQRLCCICLTLGQSHYDDEYHTLITCPLTHIARSAVAKHCVFNTHIYATERYAPRLAQLFADMSTPTTPQHTAALARLINHAEALRHLIVPYIKINNSIPPTTGDTLKKLTSELKTNNPIIAQHLPERTQIDRIMTDLTLPFNTHLNRLLQTTARSHTLSLIRTHTNT